MANENDYDGGEIKILEGLEAVRKRPGMYIGSTSASGLHHLVWEIVDNSVDEAMAGFCTEIQVTVHADNSITVVDNGRGIPVDEHPVKKIPTLEVVMTILHAGGKFDNSAYKVSGGLHGVGISVVNALSKRVVVQVRRDGNTYEMEFSRGKTVKKMEVVGTSDSTGTTVTFWPDDEIFETCIYDFDTLHNRLQETAFLNKNLKIVLTDERESTPHVEEFCYEGGIIDFVKFLNEGKDVPEAFKEPIYIEGKSDPDAPVAKMGEVEVSLQWNSGYGENVMSFANDIYTPEGGVETVLDLVGFDEHVRDVDLVITGEGNMDEQSAAGKAPVGVARRAKRCGKPVIAVVGGRADNLDGVCERGIDLVLPICRKPMDLEQALNPQEATTNLICAGEAAARSYDLGRI